MSRRRAIEARALLRKSAQASAERKTTDDKANDNDTTLRDHETRIAALESQVSILEATTRDHETRIAALEP